MKTPIKVAGVVVGVFAGIAVFISVQVWYYQVHVGRLLDVDLGFSLGSPYVRCGEIEHEVSTIESVQPGGVLDSAGFQNGDIVVGMSITGLYRALHRGRGGEVTVPVVDGGDGPALSERRVRQIRFRVPPRS
jgi:hypothetical protein